MWRAVGGLSKMHRAVQLFKRDLEAAIYDLNQKYSVEFLRNFLNLDNCLKKLFSLYK